MSDIIGGAFSVIWFIIVFTIIKGYAKGRKTDKRKAIEVAKEEVKYAARTHKSAGSVTAEPISQSGSYTYNPEEKASPAPQRPRQLKAGEARPARAALRDTSALSDLMVEDRRNDWLARQIREEKKHVVWNNFVDLGAAHDEACAAELNARDHKRRHQSYVVDDGITDN